jgi:lysophospholipase L1-like esterase
MNNKLNIMSRFAKILFMKWLFILLLPAFVACQEKVKINASGRQVTINRPGHSGIHINNGINTHSETVEIFNGSTLSLSGTGVVRSGGVITIPGAASASNVSRKAYYPTLVNPAFMTVEADIKVTASSSGNIKFGIGNAKTLYGSLAMIDQAGALTVPKWTGSTSYTSGTFSGTSTVVPIVGETYHMKVVKESMYFTVTISHGVDTFSYTNYPTKGSLFFGGPGVVCEYGTIEVTNFVYSRPNTDPVWAVFGDSFVSDGNDTPNKKWVEWLRDHLGYGYDSMYVSGFGGENSTELLARFPTEVGWITPQYVIISIGTNDLNTATYQSNLTSMIATVEAAGAIPILVTVTRRTDVSNASFITTINPWIRGLGKRYVDMNAAVCTGETTQIGGMFEADGVHPTATGYEAMWDRMLIDLADLL